MQKQIKKTEHIFPNGAEKVVLEKVNFRNQLEKPPNSTVKQDNKGNNNKESDI